MDAQGKVVAFEKTPEFLRECAARYVDSDPLRALDFLRRARELEPENAGILLEEAELLNGIGRPQESLLTIARACAFGELPAEACYGLASNLLALGMLEPALQAMRIYVARETEGENARNAREVLSVFGMLDNTQSRRAVYASSLAQRAVWLIRTGRYDRALRLIDRALAQQSDSRQLLIMKVKCCLHTGREETARDLAKYLARNEFEDDLPLLAQVLSEKPGNEALLEQLLESFSSDTDVGVLLTQLRVYVNLDCGDRIHSLLPRLLREAPYDRGALHAAAMDALRNGREENARWYWRQMLRIWPGDAVAEESLRRADLEGPWQASLSEERVRELQQACFQPGDSLFFLARWALDACDGRALLRLLDALAQSPEREGELLLREVLAHPELPDALKLHALQALVRRGSSAPYVWVSASGVWLLGENDRPDWDVSAGLKRLLDCARTGLDDICPEGQTTLERLWRRLCGLGRAMPHGERLTPALLALTLQERDQNAKIGRLASQYGQSERRLRFDAARLRVLLKIHERGNTDEADRF